MTRNSSLETVLPLPVALDLAQTGHPRSSSRTLKGSKARYAKEPKDEAQHIASDWSFLFRTNS